MYPMNEMKTEIKATNNVFISIEDFENRFGNKKEHKFKYDYLVNHENVTPAWKSIFDEWLERGILN